MTGTSATPFQIRVKTRDGKPRDTTDMNKLKSGPLGMPFLKVVIADPPSEFVFSAAKEAHIITLRQKLESVGLVEIEGGDTQVKLPETSASNRFNTSKSARGDVVWGKKSADPAPKPVGKSLKKKPYGFSPLPESFRTAAPIWHDGTSSVNKLSGEIRFEMTNLTPLLVGWERVTKGDVSGDWVLPPRLNGAPDLVEGKSVLCSLRAPWCDQKPVIIPGDSLKGLLRQELGALLGAPMERVAERNYSYRPNMMYPRASAGRRLEPRLARVKSIEVIRFEDREIRIPKTLDLYAMATRDDQSYFPRWDKNLKRNVKAAGNADAYRGGLGAGAKLNDALLSKDAKKTTIHTHIDIDGVKIEEWDQYANDQVVSQYIATLKHLIDTEAGHFSSRHPNVGTSQANQRLGKAAVLDGAAAAFQLNDIVWVEWDKDEKKIISLGWHYYYRWAYANSVRLEGGKLERKGLFPLDPEKDADESGAPAELSLVRRLLGYTGDNEGSAGIGNRDHSQLMGRISINAALEVLTGNEALSARFLPPTFLKELGMPKPSAVEHYLKQPSHPRDRDSDAASLATYGDAKGYDKPGDLAGRKFYLDRADAHKGMPWLDDSVENQINDRATLAWEASQPRRTFRFTLRFRDLEPNELAAVLVALCPDQFKDILGGNHSNGYCSKLGYARPLGWGSVQIQAKALLFLVEDERGMTLSPASQLATWTERNYQANPGQGDWLALHRRNHPDAGDYPRPDEDDREGKRHIYTYHTKLRAEHTRNRRYRKGHRP